jgi:hypothetical protein
MQWGAKMAESIDISRNQHEIGKQADFGELATRIVDDLAKIRASRAQQAVSNIIRKSSHAWSEATWRRLPRFRRQERGRPALSSIL